MAYTISGSQCRRLFIAGYLKGPVFMAHPKLPTATENDFSQEIGNIRSRFPCSVHSVAERMVFVEKENRECTQYFAKAEPRNSSLAIKFIHYIPHTST